MHPMYERIMRRTEITDDGCWLWLGATDRHGYGKIKVAGRTEQLHRIAYKLLGPAFDHRLTLDHLCRRKTCWRPAHLEPVTIAENVSRAPNFFGARTECSAGHEYTEASSYWSEAKGYRVCRPCRQRHKAESRGRRREPVPV